jgi:hypothetical protein
MEVFGIASVGSSSRSLQACGLPRSLQRPSFDRPTKALRRASVAVLTWFVVEVRRHDGCCPHQNDARSLVFRGHGASGPPASPISILRRCRLPSRWYAAVPLCTAFALILVLLQYGVSEARMGSTRRWPFSQSRSRVTDRTAADSPPRLHSGIFVATAAGPLRSRFGPSAD